VRSRRGSAVAMLILLASCTSSPNPAAQGTVPSTEFPRDPGTAVYLPEDQPIYGALYDRLGVTSTQLSEFVQRERVEQFLECMSGRGYDFPAEVAAVIVRLPSAARSPVDSAIDEIRSSSILSTLSEVPEAAASECGAELDPLNPFNELAALLETVTSGVSDRVRADSRYVEAQKTADSCTGLITDSVEKRRQIVDQVAKISTDFSSGSLTAEAAIKALEALIPDAATIDWTVDGGCDEGFMAVERSLVAEYQQEYLDDNPGFIDGLVEEFRPLVETYTKG
jgi:hypothetical protein